LVLLAQSACTVQSDLDEKAKASDQQPSNQLSSTNVPQAVRISHGDHSVSPQDRVYFGNDSSALAVEARAVLVGLAEWLKIYSYVTVTLEGHCDERGTREYNMALGQRRADTVRDYLITLGISRERLPTISYGEERPALPGSTPEAWSINRRVVFVAH
jgi:peptidoglycan-associated lipoprotein